MISGVGARSTDPGAVDHLGDAEGGLVRGDGVREGHRRAPYDLERAPGRGPARCRVGEPPWEVDESIVGNRQHWNDTAEHWVGPGRRSWSTDEVTWGVFGASEAEVQALPDVTGLDVVEIGCGTGYVSAWLARRGAASAVGLDPTGASCRDPAPTWPAGVRRGDLGRPAPLASRGRPAAAARR